MPTITTVSKDVILTEGNYPQWVKFVKKKCLTSGQLAWKCLDAKGWEEPRPAKASEVTESEIKRHDEWEKAHNAALGIIIDSISDTNE
jgi:hypothetical protein